jgi:cytochrome P450
MAQSQPNQLSVLEGDTYEIFAQLRESSPVLHLPEDGVYVVTRYDDIVTVIRDHERFSSQHHDILQPVPEHLHERLPDGYLVTIPTLVTNDPPAHTRVRKLAQKALTPSAVATYEPEIRRIAGALIDRFDGSPRAEVIGGFANPLPTHVLSSLLGIAEQDRRQFELWAHGVMQLMVPTIPDQQRLELAEQQAEFRDYVLRVLDERTRDPGEDLISGLILAEEAGEPALTHTEISGIVTQLITAGVESTTAGIGITLMMLAAHPDAMDRAIEDPRAIPTVVEEALRRMAPARGVLRETTCEVELGGQVIPPRARVFALLASANHDASRFECPHRFDIGRDAAELRQSLAFGQGTHFCLGAVLARLEIRTAVELLLERFGRFTIPTDQDIPWNSSLVFQGPLRLELEAEPR